MQLKTKAIVYDNSGALIVECLKINKKKPVGIKGTSGTSKLGVVGDIVVVAIKKAIPIDDMESTSKNSSKTTQGKTQIKVGQVRHAVIVSTKLTTKLSKIKDGCKQLNNTNGVILVEKAIKGNEWVPIGTRILIPIYNWIGHPQISSLRPSGWLQNMVSNNRPTATKSRRD